MPQVYKTEDGPTKDGPAEDAPATQARTIMPSMIHHGTSVNAAKPATQYLHLSALLCPRCNGPVIAGSLGTREDDISREIDVREIGAVCLACGFRPEIVAELSVKHHFPPVTWDWVIPVHAQVHAQPPGTCAGPLLAELSHDAGTKLVQPGDRSKLNGSTVKDGVEV
jgi:hypothetical protein